jgi:OOP family OmpA-OmpF porin
MATPFSSASSSSSLPSSSSADLTVLFNGGNAALTSTGHQVVNHAVAQYQSGQPIMLTVVGHADSKGSEYNNLLLSAQRAENVKLALVHGGVPPQNIQIQAVGISEPASNDPHASANRRVVIKR